jgi:hypothetical protein
MVNNKKALGGLRTRCRVEIGGDGPLGQTFVLRVRRSERHNESSMLWQGTGDGQQTRRDMEALPGRNLW